jgi:hypothetical protein
MKILKRFSREELEEIALNDEREIFLRKENGIVCMKINKLARIALGYDRPKPSENTIQKTADFYGSNEFVLRLLGTLLANPVKRIVIENPPHNKEGSKTIWPDRPYAILLNTNIIKIEPSEDDSDEMFSFIVD